MSGKVPQSLKEAIRRGTCVPFVGAGVSMSVRKRPDGAPLFPSWSELASRLANHLEQEQKLAEAALVRAFVGVKPPRLLLAAKEAQTALGAVWYRVLSAAFNPPREEVAEATLELPRLIWALGSPLVITTNYDKVLGWTCPNSSNLEIWEIEARGEMVQALSREGRPTVWHLHGHIQNASDLILTPDGYALLYGSDRCASAYAAALQTLRQLLTSRTLLFVGFSGADDHFGAELQYVSDLFQGSNGPHYILVRKSEEERVRSLGLPLQPVLYEDHGAPLNELMRGLCRWVAKPESATPSEAETSEPPQIAISSSPAGFLEELTDVSAFSEKAVGSFRTQLRAEVQQRFHSVSNKECLESLGYLRRGYLTIAGVLLFADSPSAALPAKLASAIVQCVVYKGRDKTSERTRQIFSGSILDQLVSVRDFIAENIRHAELPTADSMRAKTEYEYPMVCVREVLSRSKVCSAWRTARRSCLSRAPRAR